MGSPGDTESTNFLTTKNYPSSISDPPAAYLGIFLPSIRHMLAKNHKKHIQMYVSYTLQGQLQHCMKAATQQNAPTMKHRGLSVKGQMLQTSMVTH
jgi:hypothetical protein